MVLGSTSSLVLFSDNKFQSKERTCSSLKLKEEKKSPRSPRDIIFTQRLYATASLDNIHSNHLMNQSHFSITKHGSSSESSDEEKYEHLKRATLSLQNLKDIDKKETKKKSFSKKSSSTRGSLKRVSKIFSMILTEPTEISDEKQSSPRVRTPSIFRRLSRVVENTDQNKLTNENTTNWTRRLSFKRNSEPNTNSNHLTIEDDASRLHHSRSFGSLRSPFSTPKHSQKLLTDEEKTKLFTEMLECIRHDDCKRLKILVKRRLIDINTIQDSMSLLHEACFKGCIKCIKVLTKNGSSVTLLDATGWTPLHAAVAGENVECIRYILQCEASLTSITDDGWSPLHLAVSVGDLYIVHEIIMHGGDPLFHAAGKLTPFQLAINLKQTLILDYFLHLQRFLVS